MVAVTVEVAHGLCFIALTMTRPRTADEHDQDHERADQCRESSEGTELIARHLPETAAVAARRQQQDRHVLHTAAEHRADE